MSDPDVTARYIVGIDLGTTNCAVALIDTEDSALNVRDFVVPQWVDLANVESHGTLPSVLYQPDSPLPGRLPWQKNSEPAEIVVGRAARDAAADSLVRGILAEVAGLAGGFAAEQLIAQVAVRIAAMAAGGAAAGGGATATGAAAGGGGGTLAGGPVGTVVGLAGGVMVGLVIDWYAGKRLRKQLTSQLNLSIARVHRAVHLDMRDALSATCDSLALSYADVLRTRIVTPDAASSF